MAYKPGQWYSIPEWYGIQQQLDGTLLPITSAYDARNMETGDGNLSVAKGYEKLINSPVPSTEPLLKLIAVRGSSQKFYVVTQSKIYVWTGSAWSALCTPGTSTPFAFSPQLTATQVDALQTRIGDRDVIIVCTGSTQIVKIYTDDNTATSFGAGLYSYEGTVSSYDTDTMTVTLPSPGLDAEAKRRALAYGITIADYHYDVYSVPDNDPT